MKGEEEQCYVELLEYIKFLFPYFNPREAVVDYDKNIQSGLKTVFPNVIIIPSYLNQMQVRKKLSTRRKYTN